MRAASEGCDEASWGIFCIPGIATLEDVSFAAECGADFIRIGTNITEVEESEEFISLASSENMFVTSNYMKSYARSPNLLAKKVQMSEAFGVDMIYIVDSAGGMLPEKVLEYYRAVREVSDIPVGFHGHDNLGLSVANSLEMAKEGAQVIDTSLQGLGRSAGNASTEKTVAVLEKAGFDTGVDLLKVARAGQKFVNPIRSNPSQSPLAVIGGQVEFHSSHMTKILDSAYKYDVDPARLIQEVCERNKIHAPKSLVDQLAEQLQGEENGEMQSYGVTQYPGEEEDI